MMNVYEELGDTTRRQILQSLRNGPQTVSEIVDATGVKQPNVSNHLARMKARGLVKASKIGRQVFYKIAAPEIASVVHALFANDRTPVSISKISDLVEPFTEAAMEGDEGSAANLVDAALNAHASVLDIYELLLGSSMQRVGALYVEGRIDETQEHLATEVTLRMLSRLIQIAGPTRKHGLSVILGCAPNGWHMIGLRMVADYLRLTGWRTLFLGANVPIRSFVTSVYNNRPELTLLSCASEDCLEHSRQLVSELANSRSKNREFVIGIGGPQAAINEELFLQAGSDFVAKDIRNFAREVGERFAAHHVVTTWTTP